MKKTIRIWLTSKAIRLTDWLILNKDEWTDDQEEVNELISARNQLMKTYKKLNKKPSS